MEVLYARCAGLDVHKKTVVACRMLTAGNGMIEKETRPFGTTTGELLQLLDWLAAAGCTPVAMESTGEYWKPVYNILEGHLEILLVNARPVKAVPGRKTDVQDAAWLADRLRHGLRRASFVPPRPPRELRDRTRQRSHRVGERAAVVNRLQKVLEDANLKLASVVTDVTGVSARAIVGALIAGQSAVAVLAELARGRLRSQRAALAPALTGRMRDHHRFWLSQHLVHRDFLEEQIERFEQAIAPQMKAETPPRPPPMAGSTIPEGSDPVADVPSTGRGMEPVAPSVSWTRAIERLDTIPGIDRKVAEIFVAEAGADRSRFPSEAHRSAWTGVAPGNNESAGKPRAGRTRPGNPALRKALIQAAQAAAHTQNTYLSAR